MPENSILGPDNAPMVANAPYTGTALDSLKQSLAGLPLGVMPNGEVGLKIIMLNINGGTTIGIADLPTADPHVKGAVWNNAGTPTISAG